MIGRIIELSVEKRWIVYASTLALVIWAIFSVKNTPLDAVPDLSDPQVIVLTEWMGRSPDLIEDQITYPLVRALQSTPSARTVRGYSMFGMSFVYVIFEEGTDPYWSRTRVLEQLGRTESILPPDVSPTLGPDASGVGWVFQYAIEDTSNQHDLAELRELQDFTIRPALQAVPGVAEVASFGGFERQYQVVLDPDRLAAFDVSFADVARAVRSSNSEVGARVLELAGREYILRGRGYVESLADLEEGTVRVEGGTPIRIRDVARVQFGPEIRRGAADWNGQGDAVGGIVVMRVGSNALDVIEATKREIASLSLPEGVRLVPTYDRSDLILGSIATLRTTLIEEGIIVALVCMLFLLHARSALVAMIILPLSVLFSFIGMRYLGLTSNIMSLGGIAIAVGELSDAAIVLIENAHVRLAEAPPGADRKRIIVDACKEVGTPIFFSLLLITVSFLPIFTLAGQAGRLFHPLAFTKTFAMFAASILSITLAPPLMVLFLRGRFRREEENPINRFLRRVYRPVAKLIVRRRAFVVGAAALVMVLTVPVFMKLGSEFMPPLDEGSLLVMPTTLPGISIEEARRALATQHRIIMSFEEVESVHGKAGRAETATDPAPLEMIESVVVLKHRDRWPKKANGRARTLDELARDLDRALRMPGFQMAIAPPIRTRIDMLSTGVRTPVGVKVAGNDLAEIERISIALGAMLKRVPGTRSTFAERQTGREYIDVIPNREAIARYGLTVRDVHDVVEAAIGGMPVSTVIRGRARFSINLRYGADFRADPEAIARILVPVGAKTAPSEEMDEPQMTSALPAPRPTETADPIDRWRQRQATVPLGMLADVRIVTGPPMIKDENGSLVGYVFADIDSTKRDLGGWVDDAKALVDRELMLPSGVRLSWTGQYEFLAEMEERMRWVLPLTLILIVVLLHLSMKGWAQTFLVLSTLPFAVAGSIWLLAALDYNLSTAVWVGLIAVAGVAAETGIVMIVYLDEAFERRRREGRLLRPEDVDEAVVEGASARVRPLVMTVATTVLGLMPLLVASGVGADVSARTAAPVVGGLWSCMLLTLLVLPAAYSMWRHSQATSDRVRPRTVPALHPEMKTSSSCSSR